MLAPWITAKDANMTKIEESMMTERRILKGIIASDCPCVLSWKL